MKTYSLIRETRSGKISYHKNVKGLKSLKKELGKFTETTGHFWDKFKKEGRYCLPSGSVLICKELQPRFGYFEHSEILKDMGIN